ncbi:hypothetical protein SKAU_G00133160 [Synaphobranchus kaupii]|uniref:Gypsy retrotransposon integrase-like protein 1 n=1 Tax=Synaphobranchus kaupii TaxID=118154 RepID=A0A9Q1FRJ0_SYNKA|nr:hypothetical protein SKAU_G00133160 [Synaphobranchus kaupii]
MPFGLCNAPATFERLMERVLAAVPRSRCVVYLDDLLKCQLLRRETAFLGHIVRERGVATDPSKVAAVRDWPVPGNVGELRSFLGLASYYRRFVRDFATLASPLHRLTDKCRPFVWQEGQSMAFDQLRAALTEAPEDEDSERVVAYYSRALGKAERNYCVTRRELLTVVRSVVSAESPELKSYYSLYSSLVQCDSLLYRRWQAPGRGSDILQLLVPRALRPDVLRLVHGSVGAGHFGNNKTLHRLRGKFHWPGCRHDVELHVHCCNSCTAQKGPNQRSRAPLQQHLVGAPMERVGVDVLGPFPVTDSGNRYILIAMDYFTKWPEAFAVPDQSAATTAERLMEEMFTRFGAPAELHSDQGRNFESQLLAEPEEPSRTREEYYHRLRDRLLVAHDFARKAQTSAGFKQKRWYDTRCRGQAFAAGEQVWVYCPERKKGLQASWRGPGEVVERLSEVVYRIRMPGRGRLGVLHQDRLAPYRPLATPDAAEPEVSSDTALPSEPEPSDTPLSATGRPKRHRRPPGHLRDFDVSCGWTAGSSGTCDPLGGGNVAAWGL